MKKKYFSTIFLITLILLFASVYNLQANQHEDSIQEMEIKGIGFDQTLKTPVVLLTNKEGSSVLPIWIGLCEARSIELGLSDKVAPRPLTYDLIAAIVRTMNAKVERIVIVDLRDQVFYSQVELSVDGKVSKIDARPSDAIALASRMGSPIFVKNEVLKKAALLNPGKDKREL